MIAVGKMLKGYCGGYFERYSDDDSEYIVEAFGIDWLVVRSGSSCERKIYFAEFDSEDDLITFVERWSE